jgi:hypothetical protein
VEFKPSAKSVKELKAVALGLKLLDKDIKRDISRSIREEISGAWKEEIAARLVTKMDQKIYAGARVAPGNPAKAMAGTSRRALSPDGLTPVEGVRAYEFGAPTRATHETTYDMDGTTVTRHTKRQIPKAVRAGRVAYAAWSKVGPRMVSLWVQIIVRNIHEKLEGK